MRYIIIGAGAVGGVLGARLFQHSLERPPVLVARGEHGAAIRRGGLRLRAADEDSTLHVQVVSEPEELDLRWDDVLVLTTKTQHAQTALERWVDRPVFDDGGVKIGNAGDRLPVLTALNGVESERIALRLFARVFAVCVWLPSVRLTPGEVILRIAPSSGTFIIGRYGSQADVRDRELLNVISADWTASTFTIHLVDDVMRWKYEKLLGNIANALQALAGADEDLGELAQRLREEAESIYRVAEISWASAAEETAWRGDAFEIREVTGAPSELGGSSWQSIARGAGSIESDYLNGEIVLLARAHGLTAPLNQTVQRLAREAAATGAGVGSISLAELTALFNGV